MKSYNLILKPSSEAMVKRQVHTQVSRISLILQSYGLTQMDLAKKTGLSVGTINHLIGCLRSGELRTEAVKRNLRLLSIALNLVPELLSGYVDLVLIVPDKNQ